MGKDKQHLIIFKISGTNAYGASTGSLTLMTDGKPALFSKGFSGGLNSPARSKPLPSGHYRIRLDIRKLVNAFSVKDGDSEERMHHWYGIEKINEAGWQTEWGHYRAALNETRKNTPPAFRGNFLHGKVRLGDYTHGCICERSEIILKHLWGLAATRVDVRVER